MQAELRQFIDQARFYKAAILRVAELLPPDDLALDEVIAETVRDGDEKGFMYITLAALNCGRAVDARHLARGGMMISHYQWMGVIASRVTGDVPEQLLAAIDQTQLCMPCEAAALLVSAAWCAKHREGKLPEQLIPIARKLARFKALPNEAHAFMITLAVRTRDDGLLAVAKQRIPGVTAEKWKVVEDAAIKFGEAFFAQNEVPISELLAERPGNELASGTTMRRAVSRIGRNEQCPCGSGRKYKRCCHGKDQERLHHSSEVAGRTHEEVHASPEAHLTRARLEKTLPNDLGRLDPAKIPRELVVPYLKRLSALGLFERAVETFELLGHSSDLDEAWVFVLFNATKKGRKAVAERLLRWRPDAAEIEPYLHPGTRLLLAQDDPARFLELLEALSLEALQTEDSGALQKYAFGVMESHKLRALGIIVARSMLPLVKQFEAVFLFEQILDARDRLNLPPDDSISDLVDARLSARRDEGKDAAGLRQAQRSLDAKTAEVQQLKEAMGRLQREIKLRERRPEAPAESTPAVSSPGADEAMLRELRQKTEILRKTLKDRHEERNELRRELRVALADLETLRQNASPPAADSALENGSDREEDLLLPEDAAGNQPIRLIEFPHHFQQTLAGVPRHVARGALSMLGRLAGGEAAAFVGAVRLKACPGITRQRIGIDHRLLFRLLPDRVQVVDLITRQDLDRRIKTLG